MGTACSKTARLQEIPVKSLARVAIERCPVRVIRPRGFRGYTARATRFPLPNARQPLFAVILTQVTVRVGLDVRCLAMPPPARPGFFFMRHRARHSQCCFAITSSSPRITFARNIFFDLKQLERLYATRLEAALHPIQAFRGTRSFVLSSESASAAF